MAETSTLKAPFPYAGGKSWIAAEVWERLGDVVNYVEPCGGSAAVLLARPTPGRIETLNDADGLLINAYRSLQWDPDATAYWADWPVSECDLHSRHAYLVAQRATLTGRLMGDPLFYDPQLAGWWIWGACCWIGSGWCSGEGPWQVQDGQLRLVGNEGRGIHRKLPHLGDAGRGIHRKLPHLGDAGRGIQRQLPHLGNAGQGIQRQLPHLGDAGQADNPLYVYFQALADRLRRVRITCGDWRRVVTPCVTFRNGMTGVFLDPEYPAEEHDFGYAANTARWEDCWDWAMAHGTHPLLRIVLAGYDTDRSLPPGWQRVRWKARGGYGSQGQGRGRVNATREVLYCSPQCVLKDEELPLFASRRCAEGDEAPR